MLALPCHAQLSQPTLLKGLAPGYVPVLVMLDAAALIAASRSDCCCWSKGVALLWFSSTFSVMVNTSVAPATYRVS